MLTHPLLLVLVLAAPASASVDAEDPPPPGAPLPDEPAEGSFVSRSPGPPPPDRVSRTAIYGVAGWGTPIGGLGIEAVRRVGRWFELTGGLGVGMSAAGSEPAGIGHSLQWAFMPRLRLGSDHGAVTFGAGISGGNYATDPALEWCIDGPCAPVTTYPVSYFLWSNFEIGIEHWWSSGFAVRAFSGWGHAWCVSNPCVSAATTLPYLGFGLGYAF